MSQFKWYRKWRGGCWVYYPFGWIKVSELQFQRTKKGLNVRSDLNSTIYEDYTTQRQ